ncbi:hypothetical protein CGRA01v4_03967 [Colletotrichum graminicola]|nr:hypothetical protein CGRA01v4_03967 [Colletotrichum graminicola]
MHAFFSSFFECSNHTAPFPTLHGRGHFQPRHIKPAPSLSRAAILGAPRGQHPSWCCISPDWRKIGAPLTWALARVSCLREVARWLAVPNPLWLSARTPGVSDGPVELG